MNKKNNTDVFISGLRKIYEDVKYTAIDELELISDEKADITDLFYLELENKVRNGEKINIQLNANVRAGKSITAMAITKYINEELIGKNMNLALICADHLDFMRRIRNIDVENVCYEIDEFNPMASVGLNATTEAKVWEHFSEIQANRLIHTISCSPRGITDKLAEVIVEPRYADKINGKNNCIVKYRSVEGFGADYKIIGHIWVDVKPILKAKWYQAYLIKKDAKIDLFAKNNIKDIREIESAEIILDVFKQLKIITKYMKITRDYISSYVQAEITKKQQQLSFFGINDIVAKVKGLLEQINALNDIENEISAFNNYAKNKDITQLKEMQIAKAHMEQGLEYILTYYQTLINTYDKYLEIDNMNITNNAIADYTRSKRLLKNNNLINKTK